MFIGIYIDPICVIIIIWLTLDNVSVTEYIINQDNQIPVQMKIILKTQIICLLMIIVWTLVRLTKLS